MLSVGRDGTLGRQATWMPLRQSRALAWARHSSAYVVGVCALSLFSGITVLVAPRLLDPARLGEFALLSSLFQYAARCDLGLSCLADRDLVWGAEQDEERGSDILRAFWVVAGSALLTLVPLACLVAIATGTLDPLDAGIATAGGIIATVANAPVTLHRAASRIWEFTLLAFLLHLGMTAPRLVGLAVGGLTGCFAVLVAWYSCIAIVAARPQIRRDWDLGKLWSMLRTSVPLFVFALLWLVYMMANRWIVAGLSSPRELGIFAFGANLAGVGLALFGAFSQVRYPRLLKRSESAPAEASRMFEREGTVVAATLAVIALGAVLVSGTLVRVFFPAYDGAEVAVIGLAASCIPLGVATWFFPITLAFSARPAAAALGIVVPSLCLLIVAVIVGQRLGGVAGEAWGCAVAGLSLVAGTLGIVWHAGRLRGAAWLRLMAGQVLLLGIVGIFATYVPPARALTGAVPPQGWKLIFDDEFDSLRLLGEKAGVWEPHYSWGGRTNTENRELEYYIDPRPGRDAPAIAALKPFVAEGGVLSIRASEIPPGDRGLAAGFAYGSGLLTTYRTFSFTYGYAEMRAKIPSGRGLWPAFWLLTLHTWPPEIDVMEVLGHDPGRLFVTAHYKDMGRHKLTQRQRAGEDLSLEYHTYAVNWGPEMISWFLDGNEIASIPTPADLHQPMFLLVNLAVGGTWPGPPDTSTRFPAEMAVDWIRVYQRPTEAQKPSAGEEGRQ
jgi:hypothetical protein